MNNQIDDERLRLYFKQIKMAIPMHSRSEKAYLAKMQKSIEDFVRDHPDASFIDLLNQFGTPDQISQSYLSSLKAEELYKRVLRRVWFKRALILIASLAIISFSCYVGYLYKAYSHIQGGYSVQEIIEYE